MTTSTAPALPLRTLDPAIRQVLTEAEVSPVGVRLSAQLDRPLYDATAAVLKSLGAKWDRALRRHVFLDTGAYQRVQMALTTGEYLDPKDVAFFPTPQPVVAEVLALAAIAPGMTVLEPSAGMGALADAAAAANQDPTRVGVCEIVPAYRDVLRDKGYRVLAEDFLTLSPYIRVDRVVMNPPFKAQMWAKHLLHAWQMVKPRGVLVAVVPASLTWNPTKLVGQVRAVIQAHQGTVQALPAQSFATVGTNVQTSVVTITRKGDA